VLGPHKGWCDNPWKVLPHGFCLSRRKGWRWSRHSRLCGRRLYLEKRSLSTLALCTKPLRVCGSFWWKQTKRLLLLRDWCRKKAWWLWEGWTEICRRRLSLRGLRSGARIRPNVEGWGVGDVEIRKEVFRGWHTTTSS
jgi:hypothetical protein